MHRFRHMHSYSRRALAALLVGALLLVQALGLSHGLLHAGTGSNTNSGHRLAHSHATAFVHPLERLFGSQADGQHGAHHSCVAYDAASLPSLLPSAALALVLLENRYCPISRATFFSWQAPFRPNFSSRAPPLS